MQGVDLEARVLYTRGRQWVSTLKMGTQFGGVASYPIHYLPHLLLKHRVRLQFTMPTEGPDGQSITPSTTTFFNSIVSYTITVEGLGSLLTEQYNRIKEEKAQARSDRVSRLKTSLTSRGESTANPEQLGKEPPRKAFNHHPPGQNPTEQAYAIARIGSQRGYISQITEDLHLKRDDGNLKPMWALMTKGAAIFQEIFRCNITMDAFETPKAADMGVIDWSRQIRDMLQAMYNFPGENENENERRVRFLEGLKRLKENMVWYAKFMKGYLDSSEIALVQDEHLERLNKIGEDVGEFIEELQRLQDKQKKLYEDDQSEALD